MKSTNISLTQMQKDRLKIQAEKEGLPVAELMRRAVDAYLVWIDPAYAPQPKPQNKEGPFIPRLKRRGLSGPFIVNYAKISSYLTQIKFPTRRKLLDNA